MLQRAGESENKKRTPRDTAFIAEKQETVDTTEDADEVCLMAESEASKKSDSWVMTLVDLTYAFDRSAFSQLQGGRRPVRQDGNRSSGHSRRYRRNCHHACVDGFTSTIKLNNVLHIPSFGRQLLSVAQMDRRGLLVELKDGQCIIRRKNNVVAVGDRYLEMRSQDTCNTHVCKLSHSTHM